MTRTREMKAEGEQTWVVVNRKKNHSRPSSAGTQEYSQWRPKEPSRKGTKRGKRVASRDGSTPSPSWKPRHSSFDGLEDLSASSKSSMKHSASAQNLAIKSFKLVGQPEALPSSHSQSLPKFSRITPSVSSTSLSGLSTSSDDDVRLDTESENEKDLPDWKQALLEAIKEKSSQSVEVPDYIVRTLCALTSLSTTTSPPTVLRVP